MEAIDASYAVGYIRSLIQPAANPTKNAFEIIETFAKNAAKHWFKHASVHDLQDVKIYDFVRDFIAEKFRTTLRDFLAGTKLDRPAIANLAYEIPTHAVITRWG